MHTIRRGLGLMLATCLLLLAGCATPGGYGGYPGGGYGSSGPGYPPAYGNQLVGTVEGVDPGYGRLLVTADDGRSGYGQRVELRFDQRTRLYYQGRQAEVTGLERGDVIRVDAVPSGRELYARTIEVVRNIRDGGYGGHGGAHANSLRGAVAYVDPRARMIGLDGGGYGPGAQVGYDERTVVEYRGRLYRPENLERGDLVSIQARPFGAGRWLAERIVVERSVRD